MKRSRLIFFWGGIVACILITSIYVYSLCCSYPERVAEWNVQAEETFVKALELEVQKRGNIVVPFVAGVNSPEMKTLKSPYRSFVTLTSR